MSSNEALGIEFGRRFQISIVIGQWAKRCSTVSLAALQSTQIGSTELIKLCRVERTGSFPNKRLQANSLIFEGIFRFQRDPPWQVWPNLDSQSGCPFIELYNALSLLCKFRPAHSPSILCHFLQEVSEGFHWLCYYSKLA